MTEQPPDVPGLEVLAELGRRPGATGYRVRRDDVEYLLTVFEPAEGAPNREAALLGSIDHPGLPRVHEVGLIGQRRYLVTDLIAGRPLADLIAGNPLPAEQAINLVLDLVEPLAALHHQGLRHREVNPWNVVVIEDGSARLTDVGRIESLTDHRLDLYDVGVILFECLTGKLPLQTTIPELDGSAGETLATVVSTLLAKDPDEGYQSGEALAIDLRRLLADPQAQFQPGRTGNTGIGRLAFGALPLVGRDRELARFTELWEQVRAGQGRGSALRGVGGVGTTRLATEMLQIARRSGAPVLTISFAGHHPEPMAPLRLGIETLLLDADSLPEPLRAERQAQIRTAAGTAAPLLAGLSPMLGALLGASALADGDRQDQFAAAVARFITELARLSGGLLLVSDDAELVDGGTLRVMSHLAGRMPEVPLLSIGTARVDRLVLPREHPLLPAIYAAIDLDVVLEPLDPDGARALIAARLPGVDPGSALVRGLIADGDGNPTVILAQLRSIIEAGLLRPHWGSWLADETGLGRLELPVDPAGLALHRLAGLDQPTRRLLISAAVSGTRFRPEVLAQLAGTDSGTARTTLTESAGRGLIEPVGGGDYGFVDERIREAVLDGVGAEELRRLHERAAEVLPGDQIYAIADHYALGGRARTPEAAFGICLLAGQSALTAQAPGPAARFLAHACSLRPGDAQLLFMLGTALHRDGQYPQARQHLEEALLVERDALQRARILAMLTEVHRATWNTTEADRTLAQGLAELGSGLPRLRLLRALTAIVAGLAAIVVMLTGLGHCGRLDRRRQRQELLVTLNLAGGFVSVMRLQPGSLLMYRLRGTLAATRLGTGGQYSVGIAAAALTAAGFGLRRLTRRLLTRAELAAAVQSDPQLTAQLAWCGGAADYLTRVDDGERWIRSLAEHGDWLDTGQYSDTISAICWDAATQGRAADVQRWYENGRKRATFGGATRVTALITVKALSLTAAGRPAEAIAELERVRALVETHGGRGVQLNVVLAEMYALSEQGEFGEAFDEVAARFFSFRLPALGMLRQHRPVLVLHARGRLAQCRSDRARRNQSPARSEPGLLLARTAVKQLRAVASTPLLRAAYQQCRAELYLLEGEPGKALRLLARLKPQREDAPLLAFEIARTTARALLAAGYPRDGRRQISTASALAQHHGWQPRVQALEAEFGKDPLEEDDAGQPAEPKSTEAEQVERAARATHRQRELAEMLRFRPAPDPSEMLRREALLHELVRTVERSLPAERTWLIRPASWPAQGSGLPSKVMFGAELPAPGSCCELIYDQELRALAATGRSVLGGSDQVAPPQLRRLLAQASSWLVLPLRAAGVEAEVGVLVLSSVAPQAFTSADVRKAEELAAQGLETYGQ